MGAGAAERDERVLRRARHEEPAGPTRSTSAALPTALSGEEASTVSVNAPPVIVASRSGSCRDIGTARWAGGAAAAPRKHYAERGQRRGMAGLLTELTAGRGRLGFHFEALHGLHCGKAAVAQAQTVTDRGGPICASADRIGTTGSCRRSVVAAALDRRSDPCSAWRVRR